MRTAIVVGSGPSGIACASTLLDAGVRVTMLDVGLQPEREALEIAERFRDSGDRGGFIAAASAGAAAPAKGALPLKRLFGSDVGSRPAPGSVPVVERGARAWMSAARGGLSTLWGAAAVPFPEAELAGWPIDPAALRPHYRSVQTLVARLGTGPDALGSLFDDASCAPTRNDPGLGPQGRDLRAACERHAAALAARGITAGRARVAIGEDCRACGLCHHGCPFGAIFNSAAVLDRLMRRPGFSYRPGVMVTDTGESGTAASVAYRDVHSGEAGACSAERVFLACGTIATALVLAGPLGLAGRDLSLRDAQIFRLPLLRFARSRGASQSGAPTLAQMFLELAGVPGTKALVHFQAYGWNDILAGAIAQRVPPYAHVPRMLRMAIEERMMVLFGYVHSDDSTRLTLSLPPQGGGAGVLSAEQAPGARRIAAAAAARLAGASRLLGGVPLTPLLEMGLPGESAHVGASFPMRREPGRLESDLLGRPGGLRRIHAVDASVLPSIPATTITLAVMANACRIATEAVAADA